MSDSAVLLDKQLSFLDPARQAVVDLSRGLS
jgi:hypothetical protein